MFLRKCRRILRSGVGLFRRKGDRIAEHERIEFEADLRALDNAILNKQKSEASRLAKRIQGFLKAHFPKTVWDHVKEVGCALAFAIVVAFFIRQFWFELYEVPTGSMRPTVEEQDRLVVSKTTFGLHLPFFDNPLFFSDTLVKRAGIIVFTTAGMDMADSDMLYFHLIPGKKRLIKRCMGKPGDTIYFYGGHIYGVDKHGNEITELADPYFLKQNGIKDIDHIPFITFDGKIEVGKPVIPNLYDRVKLKQTDYPVGKMQVVQGGKIESTFYNGEEWVSDRPNALKAPRDIPMSYSDLWGIGNFAMARLLTKDQAIAFYQTVPENSEGVALFLELRHTPNLTYPKPQMRRDELGRIHPMITPFSTLIALNQSHLNAIQKALFTARFYVKNGHAFRYHEKRSRPQRPEFDPIFSNVPNGLYEFYYGIGYKIHFGGVRTKLPLDHPLYNSDPNHIQKLFNLGIGFNLVFEPMTENQPYNPQRFAYFRHGDLYLMGAPIIKKSDPTLIQFLKTEREKEANSSRLEPYIAFIDHGPPLKAGKVDREFIQAFGLIIPENGTLALGDNYAMSADSRDFGFVPVNNLRGSPSFIFWPPGKRLGGLPQPSYSWTTTSNLIVWVVVLIIAGFSWLYVRKRNQTSYFD